MFQNTSQKKFKQVWKYTRESNLWQVSFLGKLTLLHVLMLCNHVFYDLLQVFGDPGRSKYFFDSPLVTLFESNVMFRLLLMPHPLWACCMEEMESFCQRPHWSDVWGRQDFPYLRAKARALTYVWVKNTHSCVSGGLSLLREKKCMEEFICVFSVLMGCCQELGLDVPSDIHNIIMQQLEASWISLLFYNAFSCKICIHF